MPDSDYYLQFRIREYTHWEVYVHESQYYLGRVYVWAKRDDYIDIFDGTLPELWELIKIVWRVKQALRHLFAPDLFNYAALSNVAAHCHLHIIPRYQTNRSYQGVTFYDEQWKQNYAPYPTEEKLTKDQLYLLRDDLKSHL